MAENKVSFLEKVKNFFKNLPSNIVNGFKAFVQGVKDIPKAFKDDNGKFTIKKVKGWIYLSPAIVLLAIFTFYPLFYSVLLSFWKGYKISLAAAGEMPLELSLVNYKAVILGNDKFIEGLKNTAVLAVITVPLSTIIALLIAIGLNSIKPLRKILQTIFLLPYVTNSVAIGMVFAMIFNVVEGGVDANTMQTIIIDPGLFNRLLALFGIKDTVFWINTGAPWIAKIFVTSVYIIWNALPFKILILLGALQSVNKQYYDAAKVDGSSRFTIFRKITVPLISPMLFYIIVTGFIGAFKEYSSIVGIFGENFEIHKMYTMVGFIYDSMDDLWYGRAAAGAMVLFIIIMIVTAIQFAVSKKRVHY